MAEKFYKRSSITGRKYDYFSKDILRIINLQQVDFYMNEKGIIPLDIMLSDDRNKPGKKVVLFLFSREETKEAYSDWCQKEHETID